MEFSFVKFEKTNQRFEDRITVTTSNSFGFPTKFFKDQNLSEYKYAVIYYDLNNKAVGINFNSNDEEKHKFSILKSKKGYGGSIVATSFFKTYNIDPKIYHGKYNWEKKEQEGIGTIYIIILKENRLKDKNQPQETKVMDLGGVPER